MPAGTIPSGPSPLGVLVGADRCDGAPQNRQMIGTQITAITKNQASTGSPSFQ